MLFSAKPKGFFVELSDHGTLFARTSSPTGPMVIEELAECPAADSGKFAEKLESLQPKKSPSGYLHAICGLYPASRLIRRVTVDPKRLKDPAYFPEIMNQQFRVEADGYSMAVIKATNGTDFDPNRAGADKDVIFCGIPTADVAKMQESLLSNGVYPERVELATVSKIGALADYLSFNNSRTPTLVLEIGSDATQTFIVTADGVGAARPIPQGLDAMIPVVQKELNLKDEESARKLFYSNTFDFTGMGPLLVKRLLKELQSSIGFYEVQTGQSVGQVLCTQLPKALGWIDTTIANTLGVPKFSFDLFPWLESRGVTLSEPATKLGGDPRWFGLYSLMVNYQPAAASSNAVPA